MSSSQELIAEVRTTLWQGLVENTIKQELSKEISDRTEFFNNLLPLGLIISNNIDSLESLYESKVLTISSMLLRNVFESSCYAQFIYEDKSRSNEYYYFCNFKNEKSIGIEKEALKEKYPECYSSGKEKRYWHGFNTFKSLCDYLDKKYPENLYKYDEYFGATSKVAHPSSATLNFFLNKDNLLDYQFSGLYSEFTIVATSIHLINFTKVFQGILNISDDEFSKNLFSLEQRLIACANEYKEKLV